MIVFRKYIVIDRQKNVILLSNTMFLTVGNALLRSVSILKKVEPTR